MTDASALGRELDEAWARSDLIFSLLKHEALRVQPIPQRHPFIFYLGHLPAFAWRQLCASHLQNESPNAAFDDLFQRGIDPPTDGTYERSLVRWPRVEAVLRYRDSVRDAVRRMLLNVAASNGDERAAATRRAAHVVVEHEIMHHETLLYMLQQLEGPLKRPPEGMPPPSFATGVRRRIVSIPAGRVTLGVSGDAVPFAWDNELPERQVDVPSFDIASLPVMNGEFFEFVQSGAYDDPRHWNRAAWSWKQSTGLHHPISWERVGRDWIYRGLFEDLPLTRVFDWPAYVSWAEAQAYVEWRGARLPSEVQYLRAAYGTPNGRMRRWPWGDEEPRPQHGNFDFHVWGPVPVGSRTDGASAFGVQEVVGNGWEWTRTRFDRHKGFEANLSTYPGYSADFFDEEHYVLLGASWATGRRLMRRSFRNWFRPHYPYVFAKFRCVEDA